MKAPVSWLRDLVTLPASVTTAQLADQLTAVGLTVEHIESTESPVTGPLTVGRVLTSVDEPQKNGKTIRYCRVDVGSHNDEATDEFPASRGIVCGAHNFAQGDLVVVALPGTVLPGDFHIAARKTYGHVSDGMICSQLELGLGEDHDGIIVLAPGAGQPGDSAVELLWTADHVLDLEITPDLSYCLSMRGLAREAAIANAVSFEDPYRHHLPAAYVVPAGHQFLQRCLLRREHRDRQADNQQVDGLDLHHAQRTAGQRQVLRRVGVVAMDLRRPKGIGRQHHIRPDLVEQAVDRDRDGLASIGAQRLRGIAWAGVGTGREAGAANVANLPATDASDVLGVAEPDIHRSNDQFHGSAPRKGCKAISIDASK